MAWRESDPHGRITSCRPQKFEGQEGSWKVVKQESILWRRRLSKPQTFEGQEGSWKVVNERVILSRGEGRVGLKILMVERACGS